MTPPKKTPVIVLTGFLGSGKTTLLNRILSENHGKRIAVIENEFGEIGVDQALVIGADEEILEMNNGCVCCSVRGDLLRILGKLMQREEKFDYILIETTGLADPGPVAQTFFVDEEMKSQLQLEGIVTVVDSRHVMEHWGKEHKIEEQIAFADMILLNKTDLVSEKELNDLENKIRAINATVKIRRTQKAQIEISSILNLGGFDLTRALEVNQEFLNTHAHHHHDHEITSVGIEMEGDLDPYKLDQWMGGLLKNQGKDIFRMKGILSIHNDLRRFVFQGVHMLFDGVPDRPWGEEPRKNTLVFIGKNLDREKLVQGLKACFAY